MGIRGFKKGQGATEYLVLLAVVLIVAMVAIALLGFFPGMAGDAKTAQSDAYWRGQARPFAILEHSQKADGANITLVVQNVEAEQRVLTNISIAGSGNWGNFTPDTNQQFFSAGERRTFIVPLDNGVCVVGSNYEYYVNITYSNAEGTITDQKQYGVKTLVGKCS